MSHYVYRNLQATEISKLQLIITLYVVYIWLIVFILTSYTLSSLRLSHKCHAAYYRSNCSYSMQVLHGARLHKTSWRNAMTRDSRPETRRKYVSRPSRDWDVSTETTSLLVRRVNVFYNYCQTELTWNANSLSSVALHRLYKVNELEV